LDKFSICPVLHSDVRTTDDNILTYQLSSGFYAVR